MYRVVYKNATSKPKMLTITLHYKLTLEYRYQLTHCLNVPVWKVSRPPISLRSSLFWGRGASVAWYSFSGDLRNNDTRQVKQWSVCDKYFFSAWHSFSYHLLEWILKRSKRYFPHRSSFPNYYALIIYFPVGLAPGKCFSLQTKTIQSPWVKRIKLMTTSHSIGRSMNSHNITSFTSCQA